VLESADLIRVLVQTKTAADRSEMINDLLASVLSIEVADDNTISTLSLRVGDTTLTLTGSDIIGQTPQGEMRLSDAVTLSKFVNYLKEQYAGKLPNYLR
jgi:hypothetical protein